MQANVKLQRGFTIAEIVISLAIMLLVLGLATALFRQAFHHTTLTQENMSNEQLARIAMGKINSSLSQASEDTNDVDEQNAGSVGKGLPSVIAQSATSIAFYRVWTLAPATTLTTGVNGQPDPTYYVHVISYDPVGQAVSECWMNVATYNGNNSACPNKSVIATNVTNFQINDISSDLEYQFSITVNNINNPTLAEQPYTLVDNANIMK
jgi:prepilin-type N-terminal cleavage/methylation domain-containing protein